VIAGVVAVAFVGLGGVEGSWGQDGSFINELGLGELRGDSANSSAKKDPTLVAKGPTTVVVSLTFNSGVGLAKDGNAGGVAGSASLERDSTAAAQVAIKLILPDGVSLHKDNSPSQLAWLESQVQQAVMVNVQLVSTGRADYSEQGSTSVGLSIPLLGNFNVGQSFNLTRSKDVPAFLETKLSEYGVFNKVGILIFPSTVEGEKRPLTFLDDILDQQNSHPAGKKQSVIDLLKQDAEKMTTYFNSYHTLRRSNWKLADPRGLSNDSSRQDDVVKGILQQMNQKPDGGKWSKYR
jgi:hypothetical protein